MYWGNFASKSVSIVPEGEFAFGSVRWRSLTFKFRCREKAAGLTAVGAEALLRETASRHDYGRASDFYRSDDRLAAWDDAFAVAIL